MDIAARGYLSHRKELMRVQDARVLHAAEHAIDNRPTPIQPLPLRAPLGTTPTTSRSFSGLSRRLGTGRQRISTQIQAYQRKGNSPAALGAWFQWTSPTASAALWIPAFAGMTGKKAGMRGEKSGMTERGGNNGVESGNVYQRSLVPLADIH